jgi:tetratricopeptide (TPR) repeat protein
LHKALQEAKDNYWATEIEFQRLAVAGWIALAHGNSEDVLKFMRAAADLEDKNEKSIVTPGRILPARELLGDMLLELKQPALALKEFETSHVREPNRFRGYYGAALAAEGAGERRKAADYYAKLAELAKKADSQPPELVRAYIAQRKTVHSDDLGGDTFDTDAGPCYGSTLKVIPAIEELAVRQSIESPHLANATDRFESIAAVQVKGRILDRCQASSSITRPRTPTTGTNVNDHIRS